MSIGTPFGFKITRPGQLLRSKFLHTSILSSLMTGCFTSYFNMASLTLWESFSFVNLAEWQPIKAIPFYSVNFSSKYSRSGRTCRQLMQQYVQKSINTNLLFKCFCIEMGSFTLNQVWFAGNSLARSYIQTKIWLIILSLLLTFLGSDVCIY